MHDKDTRRYDALEQQVSENQTASPRRPWARPQVLQLAAGSAEFGGGNQVDAEGLS